MLELADEIFREACASSGLSSIGSRGARRDEERNSHPGANEGDEESDGDDKRPRVFEHGVGLHESRPRARWHGRPGWQMSLQLAGNRRPFL